MSKTQIDLLQKWYFAPIYGDMRYEQTKSLRDSEFKRLCGVKRHTFEAMLKELKAAEAAKVKPGRPCKLSLEDQLLMTLLYWREYRTLFHLGAAMGLSESAASRRVRWIEDVLVRSGRFALPKRTERFAGPAGQLQAVVVDTTETEIERPKKKQRRFYSGKSQRHTLKSEVVIDFQSGRILATATACGRCADLTLRRNANTRLPQHVQSLVDRGYQGLQHEHRKTLLPFKATQTRPLNRDQRAINRALARLRIRVEHTIRRLKVFWILARPYRNGRRRFGLRLNLIAGILNFEMGYN